MTVRDATNNPVYSGSIAKSASAVVSGLTAGDYDISATKGGTTLNGSFNLPEQTAAVVLSLLE